MLDAVSDGYKLRLLHSLTLKVLIELAKIMEGNSRQE